jgi:hypothetical protein
VNVRPLAVVTAAELASVAMTETRSTGCGNGIRRHERPSDDRRTTPSFPTSQQTDFDGAAPLDTMALTPVD